MRTSLKKQESGAVTLISTANKQFVERLNLIHQRDIIPEVVHRAKDDASKDLPEVNSMSSVHIDFLRSRYDRLVVDYKAEANIHDMKYAAEKDIKQFKLDKSRLEEKQSENKNNLRIHARLFEDHKYSKRAITSEKKALFGILLLSGSEAIFASSSMQVFLSNMLFSLIIGVTFAVALYYSAIIGSRLLKLAKNRRQFIGILAGIQTVIGAVFYTLGYFRLIFLYQMTDGSSENYHLSPLQFALIQLFFFTIAILLKYYFMASDMEKEQYSKWKEAKKIVDKLSKEKTAIENEITTLENKLSERLITRRALIRGACDVELKVQALYHNAYFNYYVKTNLNYRREGIPKCFTKKDFLPELTLYFQDESLLDFDESQLEDHV